ncbi:hypothetical protein LEP1GSC037_0545 [Leptospira interrogans str. 2006001854]|uniref:Uncharacterized protein n=1 Tax=Leptospira interrogans str. 2006001854 TaxID=1001590 RepID=M6H0D2_LEPIR|nr:hypothetical protein LEP1GSC037_0545 [Leptospira interrogans str. 2006001854]
MQIKFVGVPTLSKLNLQIRFVGVPTDFKIELLQPDLWEFPHFQN